MLSANRFVREFTVEHLAIKSGNHHEMTSDHAVAGTSLWRFGGKLTGKGHLYGNFKDTESLMNFKADLKTKITNYHAGAGYIKVEVTRRDSHS